MGRAYQLGIVLACVGALACGARTPLPEGDEPIPIDASTDALDASDARDVVDVPDAPGCVPQSTSTRYDATWMFGRGCRADWNSANVVTFAQTSVVFTGFEGTIAAANPKTGALFVTSDGIDLYDGAGVKRNSAPLGANASTAQAAAFVGRPGASGDFFVVANAANAGVGTSAGLFVTTLRCGDPTPTAKPALVPGTEKLTEALATIRHANGDDRWLLSASANGIVVIAVTASGFGPPVETSFGGTLPPLLPMQRAFIVFARDRATFALAAEKRGVVLGHFDDATGVVSNLVPITIPPHNSLYSVAFSPDQTKLYVSEWAGKYWQVDRSAGNAVTQLGDATGAVRLAIDGKLYVARANAPTLGVIANPNEPAAKLQIGNVALPGTCRSMYGFPGVGEL